jgi:hypothetical protein
MEFSTTRNLPIASSRSSSPTTGGQHKRFDDGTGTCILLTLTHLITDSELFGNENGLRLDETSKQPINGFLAMVKIQTEEESREERMATEQAETTAERTPSEGANEPGEYPISRTCNVNAYGTRSLGWRTIAVASI